MILWEGLGRRLEALTAMAQDEVVLVAPFIKRVTLQGLLERLPPATPLLCVTRWRIDELACGVSDLDIWLDLVARGNAELLLIRDLHAKYYRFDQEVIIGSCNLTNAALGCRQPSNLELAVALKATPEATAFEAEIAAAGLPATQDMYEAIRRILESMPSVPAPTTSSDSETADTLQPEETSLDSIAEWAHWLPSCRVPGALFDAYAGRFDDLTQATQAAAIADLRSIAPPAGLSRTQFHAFVAGTILSSPVLAKLAAFARTPRRFGEMRELVQKLTQSSSATTDWQAVMRWLLYFSPDRFSMHVANYSEIFVARW